MSEVEAPPAEVPADAGEAPAEVPAEATKVFFCSSKILITKY